jgi:molybdenum cofactor synthesis domain-containing protein
VIYMQYKAAVVTVSDKGFAGQREDLSGAELERLLTDAGFAVAHKSILPDERPRISAALAELCEAVDLILTTGGTGFAPRDVTPEATRDIIHRDVPGIPEAMRLESAKITNRAMLSRAIAGIRGQTLIINMPGSPKAARECFAVIRPMLEHAMETLTGIGGECANLQSPPEKP